MTTLRIITVLTVSILIILPVVAGAGDWYIIKHKFGATAVVDYIPQRDWVVIDGPYKTKDQAARAGRIDPQATRVLGLPRAD